MAEAGPALLLLSGQGASWEFPAGSRECHLPARSHLHSVGKHASLRAVSVSGGPVKRAFPAVPHREFCGRASPLLEHAPGQSTILSLFRSRSWCLQVSSPSLFSQFHTTWAWEKALDDPGKVELFHRLWAASLRGSSPSKERRSETISPGQKKKKKKVSADMSRASTSTLKNTGSFSSFNKFSVLGGTS